MENLSTSSPGRETIERERGSCHRLDVRPLAVVIGQVQEQEESWRVSIEGTKEEEKKQATNRSDSSLSSESSKESNSTSDFNSSDSSLDSS